MASRLSTVIAAAPETDLAVVEAMAAQFESYIMRGEVYRTVVVPASAEGGTGERPIQSSGGDVLARLHKLAAQSDSLSPEQKQALATAKTQIDTGRRAAPLPLPGPAVAGSAGAAEQSELVSGRLQ